MSEDDKSDSPISPPARFDLEAGASDFTLSVPYDLHLPCGERDGSLVVCLHGQGMNPTVFARHVLPAIPDGATALLPQAPLPFEKRRPDKPILQGNSWYVYLGDDEQFVGSMRRTEAWLLRLVHNVVASRGLDREQVSLLGFSQGGYLAGYVALRHPNVFDRLVVAGARIKHEVLQRAATTTAASHPEFRALSVHGRSDESVSETAVRLSAESIRAHGVPVEHRTYDAGHAVLRHDVCREHVRDFLARTSSG